MSKHIDQYGLSKIVAEQSGMDEDIVNVFIKELFAGIEQELIQESMIKVDGIGLFRIIQSGTKKRILFLGDSPKSESKNLLLDKYQPISSVSSAEKKPQTINQNLEKKESFLNKDEGIKPLRKRTETKEVDTPTPVADKNRNQKASELVAQTRQRLTENTPVFTAQDQVSTNSVPVKENVAEQPTINTLISNSPTNRNTYTYPPLGKSPAPQKSKLPIYAGLGLLVLLVIGTFIYKFVSHASSSQPSAVTAKNNETINEDNLVRVSRFAEVVNNDPKRIHCVILVDTDIPVQDLATLYYGKKLFWPYIFKANVNVIGRDLMVHENSIIKIPEITVSLVDYSTGVLDRKLTIISERVKKELDTKK